MNPTVLGGLLAAVAHVLWGLFPLYWKLIDHIDPLTILAYRVLFSFLFSWMGFFIIRLMKKMGKAGGGLLPDAAGGAGVVSGAGAGGRRRVLLLSFVAAALIAVNWYTYIWAVVSGFTLDASLGYFLTPMMNLLTGMVFLKERPGIMRALSLSMGGVAVLIFTISQGRIPAISLTLALSFGLYGYVKKRTQVGPILGMGLETLWLLAPAIYILLNLGGMDALLDGLPWQRFLLITAGPVTLAPLFLFAAAAKRIPMYSLGFFLYITPSLTFVVAWFVFGERKSPVEMLAFVLVWVALVFFSIGVLRERRKLQGRFS